MEEKTLPNLLREPTLSYEASSSRMELVELSRKGIRKDVLDNLASSLGVSMKQFAKLLPVTERTLQRRESSSLLSQALSEHAILIGEVIAKGIQVFGSEPTFQRWVHESNVGLGGHAPFSLLDSSIGAQLIQDELHRLEYGVYS